MVLHENLTLGEAYEKQEELQQEKKKLDKAIKTIYHEADMESERLEQRKYAVDNELEILEIEIKIKSKPIHDGSIQKKL